LWENLKETVHVEDTTKMGVFETILRIGWEGLGDCEHGDEPWDPIRCGGLLDWLRNSFQRGLVAVR
jgi:hypothetical protein